MAQQQKKTNDFKDRARSGYVEKVYPNEKKIDVTFNTQDGELRQLGLSYAGIGLSYGVLFMPMRGDRVIVDYLQGNRGYVVNFAPLNTDFLPYLDPGEAAIVCSDASYIHFRNKRKRDASTGKLLDYEAIQDSSGGTNIELEPGGITFQVRSKQDQNSKAPRFYEHSFMAMYDNGDINIQSAFQSKNKALIFFDGASGALWFHAGDGRPQEYIELNPLTKEIVILSDGDVHQHTQNNWKITAYADQIENVGNIFQLNVGGPVQNIPRDFDQINADSDLQQGDIRIQNFQTQGTGRLFLHIKGDVDLTVDEGDININVSQGNVNLNVDQGSVTADINQNLTATVGGNTEVTTTGNTTLDTTGTTSVTSEGDLHIDTTGATNIIAGDGITLDITGATTMHADGNMDITTTGDTTITSSGSLDLDTTGPTTISSDGQMQIITTAGMNVNSSANMNISSSSTLSISAPIVNIN